MKSATQNAANVSIFTGARAPLTLLLLGSVVVVSATMSLWMMGKSLASGVLPVDPGEANYVKHALISAMHFVPGLAFTLIGPIQFMPQVRRRWPALHRWSGRVFVLAGLSVAITAMGFNLFFPPVGGVFKAAAVYVFSVAQIVALVIAMRAILSKDVVRHRAWMLRAFAIGLGVSTMRFYFIPMYALFGLPSNFHIGLGMWIGFGVNVVVAEFILRRERRVQRTHALTV